MYETDKKTEQLIKRYSACPAEKNEYAVDGGKCTVVRHFTGEKEINKLIAELAVSRADREWGLN